MSEIQPPLPVGSVVKVTGSEQEFVIISQLPVGSIVYLKEATAKLMVVGRGASLDNGEGQLFSDYVDVVYPNGIDPEDALFFNHQDIDKFIFTGYSDEEEERYLEVYDAWQQGLVDASENETYTAESFGF